MWFPPINLWNFPKQKRDYEMNTRPKLMIIGYAGHGKDTVCEILKDKYGFKFKSSSEVALHEVIYPALKDKYGYSSPEECFEDRVNHRAEWYELIKEYNKEDKTKLARLIYADNDIYCGIRSIEELEAVSNAGLYDYLVWVDAYPRTDVEPIDSCNIRMHATNFDFYIDNANTIEAMEHDIDCMITEMNYASN